MGAHWHWRNFALRSQVICFYCPDTVLVEKTNVEVFFAYTPNLYHDERNRADFYVMDTGGFDDQKNIAGRLSLSAPAPGEPLPASGSKPSL